MSSTPGTYAWRLFRGWRLRSSDRPVSGRWHGDRRERRTPSDSIGLVQACRADWSPPEPTLESAMAEPVGHLPGHAARRTAETRHGKHGPGVTDGWQTTDGIGGLGPGSRPRHAVLAVLTRGRYAARHGRGGQPVDGALTELTGLPGQGGSSSSREFATLAVTAVFALTLVMAGAGHLFDVSGLRLVGVLGAVFFGAGAAPLQLSVRSNLAMKLGVAGVLGFAILTVFGSVMVLWSGWHPQRAAAVIVLAALVAHFLGCRRAIQNLRTANEFRLPSFNRALILNRTLACTLAGTALWSIAAATASHITAPGVLGFLPKIAPFWYAGLVLLLAAIVFARGKHEAYAALAVTSLLSALTLTPSLVYGTPRSQSAGKHIDLVLQILSQHHLDRNIGIYQAYSGFFSAIAWVCSLAHVADPLTLAACWPFVVGLIGLAELRFLFGQLFEPGYRIWVGITLAVLVNSIGADYFSPQAVGFVLGVGVYGLVLGRSWPGLPERWRIALLVFAGCSLAVTHELSPYIVGGVLVVLVIFRVIRPWYLPATILLPALLWALLNRHVLAGFINFHDLGDLSNFAPPKTFATPGLSRLPIVGESSHALALGLLVLVAMALVGFYRNIRDRSAWAYIMAPGVGLVLIVANPYGNEGIFRAALFAIPWLAALALAAVPRRPPQWLSAPLGLLSLGLLTTYLIAMFGLGNAAVIRFSDLQALAVYQRQASDNSDLLNMSYGDLPISDTFPPYGVYVLWSTVATRADIRTLNPTAGDLAALTKSYIKYSRSVSSAPADELYAIWSPASAQYAVDYGLQTWNQAVKWRALMAKSTYWHVVFSTGGTYLFRLVPQAVP